MKYKLDFSLSEFTELNSLMTILCSEYIPLDSGLILCKSLLPYSPRVVEIKSDKNTDQLVKNIQNLLVPPNLTKDSIKNLKKTKTFVRSKDDGLEFYEMNESPADFPDIVNDINIEEVKERFKMNLTVDIPRITENTKDRDSILEYYQDTKYKEILDFIDADYDPLDIIELKGLATENSHMEVVDKNDPNNTIIVSKQCFPDIKKIISLGWTSVKHENLNTAVFKSEYKSAYVYSLFHYLNFNE